MMEISEKNSVENLEELRENINTILDNIEDNYSESSSNSSNDETNRKKDTNNTVYEKFFNAIEQDVNIDPGRLMGLTDGIFGMVLTLLIFGIGVPSIMFNNPDEFNIFLFKLIPQIGITIISFIVISSFWIYHHEFIKIKTLNIPYIWLNMFFLISISFTPFTTSLIGTYSKFFVSGEIFGLNIFLSFLFLLLMYDYSYKKGFLINPPSKKEKKYVMNTFFYIMILTTLINVLDYCVSPNFIYLFLVLPILSTIRDIIFKLNT